MKAMPVFNIYSHFLKVNHNLAKIHGVLKSSTDSPYFVKTKNMWFVKKSILLNLVNLPCIHGYYSIFTK